MTRLRLSAAAHRDLRLIQLDGEEKFGRPASVRHMAKFERLFALLRDHPFAGPARPDYGKDIRLLANPPHRILYQVQPGIVVIARVLHASRDVHHAMQRP